MDFYEENTWENIGDDYATRIECVGVFSIIAFPHVRRSHANPDKILNSLTAISRANLSVDWAVSK